MGGHVIAKGSVCCLSAPTLFCRFLYRSFVQYRYTVFMFVSYYYVNGTVQVLYLPSTASFADRYVTTQATHVVHIEQCCSEF